MNLRKKHKKICKILNYTEHLIILASTVTGCVSIFALASFVGFPVGIASSTAIIEVCVITARIKKYKSIIKNNNKKYDEIVLLPKTKLKTIDVLDSEALIDSFISYDEFVSVNNVLKEYYNMKEEIKNSNDK